MSYSYALETAGAIVHVFSKFGSYQGDWWAKVTWNGKKGWVHGYYGSCSGCDALEGEFGCDIHKCGDNDWYDPVYDGSFRDDCALCLATKERFAEFGRGYLDDLLTQEGAEAEAAKHLDWDFDAKEMVEFIQANRL